jgi:urease accessory protein
VGHAVADVARTFAANRAVGGIALAVRASAGATRRSRVREDGALRVRCPGPASGELEAVIVNTAGGVAGGDRFTLDVTVEPRARLVVTTAAAEKVYRTLAPDATIDVRLNVAAAASLAWLPQETILFDRARLKRTIDIDLAEDARLVLAEAIVFGRAGMGETVDDSFLLDRWRLRRGGRLIHAEALRLDGAVATRLARRAVAEGGIAVATVLVVPGDEGTAAGVRALRDRLRGEVGVSAWNGLAVVRLCAADGEALRHDLVAVLAAVRGASLPRLWLN